MKKLYSTIMTLAMMVAALGFAACGGDDDDDVPPTTSIVGAWEFVSGETNPTWGDVNSSFANIKFYFNADGTYSMYLTTGTIDGRWNLNGSTLTLIPNSYNYQPSVSEVVKLTSKELVLRVEESQADYSRIPATTIIVTFTLKFKRIS